MSTEPNAPPSDDNATRQEEPDDDARAQMFRELVTMFFEFYSIHNRASPDSKSSGNGSENVPSHLVTDAFEWAHRGTKQRVAMVLDRRWNELRPIVAKKITDVDLATAYMLLLQIGMRLEGGTTWDRARLQAALDAITEAPPQKEKRYALYVHQIRRSAKRYQEGVPHASKNEIVEHLHTILVQWHDKAFLGLSLKTLAATLRSADLSNSGGPSKDGAVMTAALLAAEVGAFGAHKIPGDLTAKARKLASLFAPAASQYPDTPQLRHSPPRKR